MKTISLFKLFAASLFLLTLFSCNEDLAQPVTEDEVEEISLRNEDPHFCMEGVSYPLDNFCVSAAIVSRQNQIGNNTVTYSYSYYLDLCDSYVNGYENLDEIVDYVGIYLSYDDGECFYAGHATLVNSHCRIFELTVNHTNIPSASKVKVNAYLVCPEYAEYLSNVNYACYCAKSCENNNKEIEYCIQKELPIPSEEPILCHVNPECI